MSTTPIRPFKVTRRTLLLAMLDKGIMTFRDLSRKCGINAHTISRGLKHGFPVETLAKIAEALEVNPRDLIDKL